MQQQRRRHMTVLVALGVLIAGMTTLVAFSVPLYRMFCEATGLGGTTQRAASDTAAVSDRIVTVRFNTDIAADLPWRFAPVEREVKVHLGEEKLVFFTAENRSDKPIIGHATFNVTPAKAGLYFNKVQCFCFDDERLGPGERVDMPVDFFVDPAMLKDANAADVDTITLSYTFYRSANPDDVKDLSRFEVSAPASPDRGRDLFAERCAACHALDKNKAGPMLGDVFGRRAGAAAGYKYSPALSEAAVTWSRETLDKWLADPKKLIPGARMPVRVLDASTRRDIIAYLAQLRGTRHASGDRR